MAQKKRGRGRPPVFTGNVKKRIVKLLKQHGNSTHVEAILESRNGVVGVSKAERENAALRKAAGIEKPIKISQPTLLKIAKEAGVELQRGRPSLAEAA